jgi:hypothetical protein
MMNTRRSLLTLAVVGLLALAGPVSAQDSIPAVSAPATTAVGAITLAPGSPTYSSHIVSWVVPPAYASNCGNDAEITGQNDTMCDGDETPLDGYIVYKSTRSFPDAQNAEVTVKVPGTGPTTGPMVGMHRKVMEDLKPNTRYYIRLAAENAAGVGVLSGEMTFITAKAPDPDRVTDVMVMPLDQALMVEWTAPHPDSVDQTDLKIAEYHLQYRTSETRSRSAGDWTPPIATPMMVDGSMTEATIKDLTNGTMYDVQVRAENSAGGKGSFSRQTDDTSGTPSADAGDPDDDMTETPALPLFGILALFGGLLAAGRARLRR